MSERRPNKPPYSKPKPVEDAIRDQDRVSLSHMGKIGAQKLAEKRALKKEIELALEDEARLRREKEAIHDTRQAGYDAVPPDSDQEPYEIDGKADK